MKKYRIKSDKRIGQPLVGSVCYFTLGVGYHSSGFMRVLFSDGQMIVGTEVDGEGASSAPNYGRRSGRIKMTTNSATGQREICLMIEQTGERQMSEIEQEAQRVLNRLDSSDPDFNDCADAAALIIRMLAERQGPDGYATWKDAAIAERLARSSQPRPAVPEGWDDQAYASMRDEVEYHKRRADAAESDLSRLQEDLAPTHMGEPVIPAWTGWGCQYPGKMPRLYGSREIAELNCDPENGDRLLFLASSPQSAIDFAMEGGGE